MLRIRLAVLVLTVLQFIGHAAYAQSLVFMKDGVGAAMTTEDYDVLSKSLVPHLDQGAAGEKVSWENPATKAGGTYEIGKDSTY